MVLPIYLRSSSWPRKLPGGLRTRSGIWVNCSCEDRKGEKASRTRACIDEYLWSLYERTPKVDTNKVTERIKTTVKRKGKTRTVTKTITKYVVADFTREGSDRGTKSRHVAQGLCDRGHGPRLQAEAVPGASRDGRCRVHAGHHQRIPRRLPTIDRKR